jgi:hypothetical protein
VKKDGDAITGPYPLKVLSNLSKGMSLHLDQWSANRENYPKWGKNKILGGNEDSIDINKIMSI